MQAYRRFTHRGWGRAVALAQIALLLASTSCSFRGALAASSGLRQYQEPLMVTLPGVELNVAGGNAVVRRVDLSIDTRIGSYELGATYNSTSGQWLWSFEEHYDGSVFADASGAVYDTASLSSGEAVAGSVWVVVGPRAVATKGGLVHEFDAAGRLSNLHWSVSDYPRLAFGRDWIADQERVVAIDQCVSEGECSSVFVLEYDGSGRLLEIVDRAGRVAAFGYDAAGRLASARDGLDTARGWQGFRYEYDGSLLTAITNSEGERIEYGYVDGRLAIARRAPHGAGATESYLLNYGRSDQTGLYFTVLWNGLGVKTVYRYDAEGRLHELENGEGEIVRWRWQGLRPVEMVDAAGAVTRATYSGDDPVERIEPSGNVVSYRYPARGVDRGAVYERPVLEIADSLGLIERRGYDAEGRLLSIENGAGEVVSYSYDAREMLASVTDAAGLVTSFSEYGSHGHAARVERAGAFQVRVYDTVGNLLDGSGLHEVTSPGRPGIGARRFDADRNLEKLELVEHHAVTVHGPFESLIEYRSDGRPRRISRPYGGSAEFDYDAYGQLVARRELVDGAWRATRYEYDEVGRLVAEEQANGMRREQRYDAAGRPVELRWLRHGVTESYRTLTYAAGRLVSSLDSAHGAEELIVYDAAGRPGVQVFPQGEAAVFQYDLRGRELQRRLFLEEGQLLSEVGSGYDGADRLIRRSLDGLALLEHVYANGRLARVVYGNGLVRSFDYSPELESPVGATTLNGAGEVVERSQRTDLGCDPMTPIRCIQWTTETERAGGGGVTETSHETHVLGLLPEFGDDLPVSGSRLLLWSLSEDALGSLVFAPRYSFDALGNITQIEEDQVVTQSYDYNQEHNRLLSGAGHTYEYDAAGYVTSRDGVPFDWTASGKIAAIGSQRRFEWDVLGRLVASTVEGVESRTRFGGLVQATALGEPVRMDLDEVVIWFADDPDPYSHSYRHSYRHYDFRKNVKFVSNDAGQVVLHYRYSGFGVDEVYGEGSDYRSFAQGWDIGGTEIGDLMILGERIYDPDAGRFLSPEPLYHPVNQYSYTLGNPVDLWDPTGLEPCEVGSVDPSALQTIGSHFMIGGFVVLAAGISTANVPMMWFGASLVVLGIAMILMASVMGCGAGDAGAVSMGTRSFGGGSPGGGVSGRGGGGPDGSAGGGSGMGGGSSGSSGSGGSVGSSGSGGLSGLSGLGNLGGTGTGACAPARLVKAPGAGWLLGVLVSLQVMLSLLLFRGRRRRQRHDR